MSKNVKELYEPMTTNKYITSDISRFLCLCDVCDFNLETKNFLQVEFLLRFPFHLQLCKR